MYAKQGRSAKFSNKKERDNWLKKEVEEVDTALAQRKSVMTDTDNEIAELQNGISKGETEVEKIRKALNSREDTEKVIDGQIREAKDAREKLQDQRKELWREQAKLDTVTRNAKDQMQRAEDGLSRLMDRDTARGIEAVRNIKNQRKLTGVYGTLAELFQVGDGLKTAVEATAGNSLFHYVVDTDETASQLLEIPAKRTSWSGHLHAVEPVEIKSGKHSKIK